MKKLLGPSALLLVAQAAIGQCVSAGPGATSYGPGDDSIVNGNVGIAIGFAFPIGGTSFTHVHPSTNGFAYLADGITAPIGGSDYTASAADLYGAEPRVAGFWTDLDLDALNGGELFVDTSVANQCTITWQNAVNWGDSVVFTAQCTLYSTGEVSYRFSPEAFNADVTIVGVSPGNGAAVLPAGIDLSAGAASTDECTYEEFSVLTLDLEACLLTPLSPGFAATPSALNCAEKVLYGTGCVSVADAVHEQFAIGTIDICGTGTAITFQRGANGYTMTDAIPGAFVAPTAGAVVISTSDDAYVPVALSNAMPTVGAATTTDVVVATNGFLVLSANLPGLSAGSSWNITEANFDGFTDPTICGPWYDFNAAAAGQILGEEVGNMMYITWDAVAAYGSANFETVQYQINETTGDVTVVYQDTYFDGTSGWQLPIFGMTMGSAAVSDTADMSADLPAGVEVGFAATAPLALDSNLPQLGTNWDLTTSNIDAASPVGFTFFSDVQDAAGTALTSVGIAAPGCYAWIGGTLMPGLTATNTGGTSVLTVAVPNNGALLGMQLAAQSLCLTTLNPANILTSNGLLGTVGN